jgi:hypothetical protein
MNNAMMKGNAVPQRKNTPTRPWLAALLLLAAAGGGAHA